VCDCVPDDDSLWSVPQEVPSLSLGHAGGVGGTTTLEWSAPADLGGTEGTYDALRAPSAYDWTDGLCLDVAPGATVAADLVAPPSGQTHYFLVRARNGCGLGPLGGGHYAPACPAAKAR
jgi:hypothetical protein